MLMYQISAARCLVYVKLSHRLSSLDHCIASKSHHHAHCIARPALYFRFSFAFIHLIDSLRGGRLL